MSTIMALADADRASAGGKAGPLADLLRAGFDVPPGFVVPRQVYRDLVSLGVRELSTVKSGPGRLSPAEVRTQIRGIRLPGLFVEEVRAALAALTAEAKSEYVAVRSSASTEDGAAGSAAGQHDTVLAVRGTAQVCAAILHCWASLWTDRAAAYRSRAGLEPGEMAVLVQSFIDPVVSGVMFTGAAGSTIEAAWGLAEPMVAGQLTPDSWCVEGDRITARRAARKAFRTDRAGERVLPGPVAAADQQSPCLHDSQVLALHELGGAVTASTGSATDIEWAIDAETTWILQARPVTAPLPEPRAHQEQATGPGVLTGVPASPGTATGIARVVRGPGDFASVRPGDVLVCADTDPAWTPLFSLASGVVTETGGVLSHAAIVAREIGIPAVLSVPEATRVFAGSPRIMLDGDTGHICAVPLV